MLIGAVAGQERDTGRTAGAVVVNCGGVGYAVRLGARDTKHIAHGKSVTLYTRQILLAEDTVPVLFGWFNERDRALFDTVVRVQGCGPVRSCAIVDCYDIDDLRAASAAEIAKRVDGVGKVMAERIAAVVKA